MEDRPVDFVLELGGARYPTIEINGELFGWNRMYLVYNSAKDYRQLYYRDLVGTIYAKDKRVAEKLEAMYPMNRIEGAFDELMALLGKESPDDNSWIDVSYKALIMELKEVKERYLELRERNPYKGMK